MKLACKCLVLAGCAVLMGCADDSPVPSTVNSASGNSQSIVLVSVQSDATENTQSIDMAMKLAGFSIDEGRKVAIFFNVKGVQIPTKSFASDLKFEGNDPIKAQLENLIARGVEVHVCPICMEAFGITAADIMQGAFVTTRPKLFANIGADTAVFTY